MVSVGEIASTTEVTITEEKMRTTWKQRLQSAYWLIIGLVGLGRPIVDRRSMYGDDPRNDPYSIEFDPRSQGRR